MYIYTLSVVPYIFTSTMYMRFFTTQFKISSPRTYGNILSKPFTNQLQRNKKK